MLTQQEVAWKTKKTARDYCKKLGYKYLSHGAFSVYYQKPDDKGKTFISLSGNIMKKYSETNWIDVFTALDLYT